MHFTRRSQSWLALMIAVCGLMLAVIACQGNAANMAVLGIPRYICPSSTPRPTDMLPPPSAPTYPPVFQVIPDYYFVDSTRSAIQVQYMAQNVGTIQIVYSGTLTSGMFWTGGNAIIAYTGNYVGVQNTFTIYFPINLSLGQITVYSSVGSVPLVIYGYSYPVSSNPLSPPCCLPLPIYPTPMPTYTPYPTPTLFQMQPPSAFYLNDPIYNDMPPIRLRMRMKAPINEGMFSFIIPLFSAASWTIEITNVGTQEYDFLGAGYTFITEVEKSGVFTTGVWPPSHYAATFLGILEQAYGPQAVMPGQTITIQVSAWIPVTSHVSKISLVLDPYHSGDPGWATFTPGSIQANNMISWTNAINTVCAGDIQYP